MDYSVTSRWTQSAETVVNGNATVTRGSSVRQLLSLLITLVVYIELRVRCVCVSVSAELSTFDL